MATNGLDGLREFHKKVRTSGPIDANGLQAIADYKYVAGSYTPFDLILNPFANQCAELLPTWMAPNLVTSLGGMCVVLMFVLHVYYSPNFEDFVPSWVLALNGVLAVTYTWMDWLDGKQARRTGTSSPLGQLFDHGVDCMCVMANFIITTAILSPHTTMRILPLALLTLTQTGFYLAQLVEYYYHWLPHNIGGVVGVTESNFGFGALSVLMACVDRSFLSSTFNVPFLGNSTVADVLCLCLCAMLLVALAGPLIVVPKPEDRLGVFTAAAVMLAVNIATIFLWPASVVAANTRLISVACWSVSCYVTLQVIVFSMAKQEYSRLQWPVLGYVLTAAAVRYLALETATLPLILLTAVLLALVFEWAAAAIDQITTKLGIRCFTITPRKD
eukprot:TRINITY_DN12514_c0_g1_i1.p1 TRINITY_DN12514_c0_g1~~TRINITY_DN12514_c0_g1_i1.p1  ORF type:complete len:387 (+),score=73.34 TRINITY_DN12514_c0_g1_i1:61-1221(+)